MAWFATVNSLINNLAGVDTLRSRREELTRRFFTRHVLNETSCLHYLLPPKRDENITGKAQKKYTFCEQWNKY